MKRMQEKDVGFWANLINWVAPTKTNRVMAILRE
jgi:hypothetical protein